MKTLFIHIGTEKTGTTAIQHCFAKNRDLLHKHGINYPKIGYTGLAQFSLVSGLILEEHGKSFEVDPQNYTPNKNNEWEELIDNINSSPCKTHFICVEHFSSRLTEKSIKWIADTLKKYKNISTKILCYFRRPNDFLESTYSTAVKAGDCRNFDTFYKSSIESLDRYNYFTMIETWSKHFGIKNLETRLFIRDNLENNDIIDDVLTTIFGIKYKKINLERKNLDTNKAWDPITIRLALYINNSPYLKAKYSLKNRFNLLNKINSGNKNKDQGRYFLTSEQARDFNSKVSNELDLLSKYYFNDKPLFRQVDYKDNAVIKYNRLPVVDAIEQFIFYFNNHKNE